MLVIESDDALREVLVEMLCDLGYEARGTASLETATVEGNHTSTIAIVSMLHGSSENERLQQLRTACPDVRQIIAMIAAPMNVPVRREIDAVLVKPFTSDELRAALVAVH